MTIATEHVPAKSRSERTRSFNVADFPQVNGREEEWRFTPVKQLSQLLSDEESGAELSVTRDLPTGVDVSQISLDEARQLGVPSPEDLPAVIAANRASSVTRYDIGEGVELESPAFITTEGASNENPVHNHTVVTVGAHASATIVIKHTGNAQLSELLSVIVGPGARVKLVTLQLWDDDAVHLGQHDAVVGKDAQFTHIAITLGGKIVRLNSNVSYDGPGGEAQMLGLYFADAGQHLEHRTYVDHNTPNATSDVLYKGALQGKDARSVWIGDVLIRPEAKGIDTYELNRNLVLTEGARADSVPNLEIETGEIEGAGHASSTGRFDEEHLFYLMSRGIDEKTARRLVVRGFFNEVIQKIDIEQIEEVLTEQIEEELSRSVL
ncbi:Fe-S cluster assembly protein SufD [Brevibacterium sp. UMB1308A]|uniref:Fe-S cluster assembly protein SufD n=1 Tax=Brevibacterium sp. UMB1308A TaxID=3050608 RepID=UPI00254B8E4B|nr:Fe-S cluster assembly protein SufD [Brevibacterium sp. UMB1308A]MDK8345329.1 Fe-S cluster assembly protein SufD [Brevibacterium sp. UMB1308B]MDK8713736.1 Fe-S cluster assembly protein SufD [Brevibacterium sp. UMB1308A]